MCRPFGTLSVPRYEVVFYEDGKDWVFWNVGTKYLDVGRTPERKNKKDNCIML